jgi:CBS domain-containing protein
LEAAVRVRDVMSSPVVCVPPDMALKEVAHLLVRHGISAVPVVEDGELVGIVSEADLVPLELAPDPRAHLIPPADAPAHLPKVVAR